MRYFKCPSGSVKFKMGDFERLPYNAEEIKLYMVSGDPSIYIVPVSEIPYSYTKIISKSEEEFLDPIKYPLGDFG